MSFLFPYLDFFCQAWSNGHIPLPGPVARPLIFSPRPWETPTRNEMLTRPFYSEAGGFCSGSHRWSTIFTPRILAFASRSRGHRNANITLPRGPGKHLHPVRGLSRGGGRTQFYTRVLFIRPNLRPTQSLWALKTISLARVRGRSTTNKSWLSGAHAGPSAGSATVHPGGPKRGRYLHLSGKSTNFIGFSCSVFAQQPSTGRIPTLAFPML